MTDQYLRSTTADYITGAISACEGIRDSIVLINGPHGCKTYYGFGTGQSAINGQALLGLGGDLRLSNAMDDKLIRSQFFTGSPLIPATNLRYEDFIFGTAEQLRRALNDILSERRYSLISVVQAPGTSLLSESLEPDIKEISEEASVPYLYVDAPGLSEDMFTGYDETVLAIIKKFSLQADNSYCDGHPSEQSDGKTSSGQRRKRPSVNLFGLYTRSLHMDGDLEEITRILDLCGIDINCAVGAFCTMDELKDLSKADANVFLAAERCKKTAEYLEKVSGIPSFNFGCVPVGPDLTEKFVIGISSLLKTDCRAALKDIEETRSKIFYYLAKYLGNSGFGGTFRYAAEGEPSLLFAYADYLSGYLGIAPEVLQPRYELKGAEMDRLEDILGELGCKDVLVKDITKVKDVVILGNANTIAQVLAYSGNVYGIETEIPSSGYINVVPKTHIGCKGSLYLLEQLLNAKRLLSAWD